MPFSFTTDLQNILGLESTITITNDGGGRRLAQSPPDPLPAHLAQIPPDPRLAHRARFDNKKRGELGRGDTYRFTVGDTTYRMDRFELAEYALRRGAEGAPVAAISLTRDFNPEAQDGRGVFLARMLHEDTDARRRLEAGVVVESIENQLDFGDAIMIIVVNAPPPPPPQSKPTRLHARGARPSDRGLIRHAKIRRCS